MSYKELFKAMITIISCIITLTIGLLFLVISIPFIWNKWYNKHIYDPITDMLDDILYHLEGYGYYNE